MYLVHVILYTYGLSMYLVHYTYVYFQYICTLHHCTIATWQDNQLTRIYVYIIYILFSLPDLTSLFFACVCLFCLIHCI